MPDDTTSEPGRVLAALAELSLFDNQGSAELQLLARYMEFGRFLSGQAVFLEGEQGAGACFVVEGQLDVVKEDASGKRQKIARLGPGRAIGEMALVDGAPRSASVVAASDGALLWLRRSRFEELLAEHPAVGVRLLRRIARLMSLNLRRTSAVVAELLPDPGAG